MLRGRLVRCQPLEIVSMGLGKRKETRTYGVGQRLCSGRALRRIGVQERLDEVFSCKLVSDASGWDIFATLTLHGHILPIPVVKFYFSSGGFFD